ncbi:MAG: hypothetical protein CTY23_08045 [Methylomonas sp.]|nr:MAG: hypothetical protein CTY23_08045 [Methylomonas sp.]
MVYDATPIRFEPVIQDVSVITCHSALLRQIIAQGCSIGFALAIRVSLGARITYRCRLYPDAGQGNG